MPLQLKPVVESKVDVGLVHALLALAGMDCDSQRLAGDQEQGSHVVRDSFAGTAACDDRKDIAGILAGMVACDHKTGLSAGLEHSRGTHRVEAVANEILASQHLEDE